MVKEDDPQPPPHEDEDERSNSKYMNPIITIIITILISIFISSYINYIPKSKYPSFFITNITIPAFFASADGSAVSLTLAFNGLVVNPSSVEFTYFDTSANLFYDSQKVGSMPIPGRRVASGMENVMEVSINVNPIPVSVVGKGYIPVKNGLKKEAKLTMELELSVNTEGRTANMWFYKSNLWRDVDCRILVLIFDGSLHYSSC